MEVTISAQRYALFAADTCNVAGARKESAAVLVERYGQDLVSQHEGLLDAISMVDVYVNVQHPSVVLQQLQDRQHDVIDIAEATRLMKHTA